jgi:hypothetical protein
MHYSIIVIFVLLILFLSVSLRVLNEYERGGCF